MQNLNTTPATIAPVTPAVSTPAIDTSSPVAGRASLLAKMEVTFTEQLSAEKFAGANLPSVYERLQAYLNHAVVFKNGVLFKGKYTEIHGVPCIEIYEHGSAVVVHRAYQVHIALEWFRLHDENSHLFMCFENTPEHIINQVRDTAWREKNGEPDERFRYGSEKVEFPF